jgi:hypothetical protein
MLYEETGRGMLSTSMSVVGAAELVRVHALVARIQKQRRVSGRRVERLGENCLEF